MAIGGHEWPSSAIRGNQWASHLEAQMRDAIIGNQ